MVLTGKLITNCGNQPCIELRIVGLWAGGPGAGGNKLPVGSGGDDLVAFTKQKLLVTPRPLDNLTVRSACPHTHSNYGGNHPTVHTTQGLLWIVSIIC